MFIKNLKNLAAVSPLYAVAGLSFFMGMVLVGIMGGQTLNNLVLMKIGQRAEGHVVEVVRRTISEGGGAALWVEYIVEGKAYSGKRYSRSSSWQKGESLTVIHHPKKPGRFILEQETMMAAHWKQNIGMTIVGLVLLLAGVQGASRWVRRAYDLGILEKRGSRFKGRLLKVKKRNYKMGQQQPVYIEYSFLGLSDREYRGLSENLPKNLDEDIGPGLVFTVLQDPLKPSRHMADVWSIKVG